jgi:hypothetical protein
MNWEGFGRSSCGLSKRLFWNLLGGTELPEASRQAVECLRWDSNQAPPKYNSRQFPAHWTVKSQPFVHNKLLLYKQVLKPIWTYGIQLWGCADTSNIDKIQIFQNKALRGIVDGPWYYRNDHLHRDLKIPTIRQENQRFTERHERRLHNHVDTEVLQLWDDQLEQKAQKDQTVWTV